MAVCGAVWAPPVALIVVLVGGCVCCETRHRANHRRGNRDGSHGHPRRLKWPPMRLRRSWPRLGVFGQALRNGQPAEPLVLTEDEVNVAIQSHPDWAMLKGRIHVTLSGDEAGGKISMPPRRDGLGLSGGALSERVGEVQCVLPSRRPACVRRLGRGEGESPCPRACFNGCERRTWRRICKPILRPGPCSRSWRAWRSKTAS